MIRRVVFALLVGGVVAESALAQSPSSAVLPTPQAPPIRDQVNVPPPPPRPAVATANNSANQARRSIARSTTSARRTSVSLPSDPIARRESQASVGRFENPGGVGRYSEYYTASTPTSQLDLHAMPQTRFDRGGGPDRAEQIASFRAGQQRTANIQNNINAYGRPYGAMGAGLGFGFGLGYGLYGGGLGGGGMR
jgi:hypothetical protein